MKVQVLLATMNQLDQQILDKMNISSDIIIGNQGAVNEVKTECYKGNEVMWLSFAEKGVGLNRNNALMRASGDIGLIADDDVVYCDDYVETVSAFFEKTPKADVVIFNMKVKRGDEPFAEIVKKTQRIGKKKAARYGTYCIGVRIASIRQANVYFHLEFGGGAKYSCGEDTIFLQECLKKGLRVYTCADLIGTVNHGESTWFTGYNDKFFVDKGVCYRHLHPRLFWALAFYHCFRHRDMYKQYGWMKAFKNMCLLKK